METQSHKSCDQTTCTRHVPWAARRFPAKGLTLSGLNGFHHSWTPKTSTNLWQTLLSSSFCSYEHFFLIRALFKKKTKFEQKSTSMGFRCFGACELCCGGPHPPRSRGWGRKLHELCCSGNKCVFSGSLTNLHMLDAFWHFEGSLQPATSSAISRNSSAISRNRAQF